MRSRENETKPQYIIGQNVRGNNGIESEEALWESRKDLCLLDEI